MPPNVIKSFADKTDKSVGDVEKLYQTAKKSAKDQGKKESDKDFYPYVIGILKKMLKIDESRLLTFKELIRKNTPKMKQE